MGEGREGNLESEGYPAMKGRQEPERSMQMSDPQVRKTQTITNAEAVKTTEQQMCSNGVCKLVWKPVQPRS